MATIATAQIANSGRKVLTAAFLIGGQRAWRGSAASGPVRRIVLRQYHGVQFVIIGGMAARLHDTGHATVDVDLCPSTDDASLSEHASVIEIATVEVPVASLEDVVASKGAAGDRRTSLRCHLSKLVFDAREGPASPRRIRGKSARAPLTIRNDR